MAGIDADWRSVLDTDNPYSAKRPVLGRVVCVLDASSERRGMQLELFPSRAVRAGEIHELVLTEDPGAGPRARIDRVAYVGFVEVTRGGVILVGDSVTLGERELGQVAGFDYNHFPNHMNIVLRGPTRETGRGLGVALEDLVVFADLGRSTPG
jgi:hypothetical protein